jgi:hypothetical protein
MSGATGGYVSGLDYLYDFQPELGPLRVQLTLLAAELEPPRITTACELGFGQGISVNIHAAAQAVRWYGTDFNPAQVGFARELALASGAEPQLFAQSFAEFCARADLPEFDLIGLHGVWSWVSDDNRALIVDFLRRKLRVGGAAYISYNVQPGYAPLIPLHPLLIRHAGVLGRPGEGLAQRVDAALAFAERVVAVSPGYAAAHPGLAELLRSIRRSDRRYLAHEYLNANWAPTSFTRVAEVLSAAGLEYGCSPFLQQTPEALELTAGQRTLLAQISAAGYRELVRDLMANRSFRMDYWVREPRRLSPGERIERMLEQHVMMIREPGEILPAFARALPPAAALQPLLAAALESLADHRPRTLADIGGEIERRGFTVPQLCTAINTLVSLGGVVPVQDEAAAGLARARTDRLNTQLCDQAARGADIGVLASPVTGSGFAASGGRVALLFLQAMGRGAREPRDLGAHVQQIFGALGIGLFRDGRPVQSAEESLALLSAQAQYFLDRQLPVLRAMQIS